MGMKLSEKEARLSLQGKEDTGISDSDVICHSSLVICHSSSATDLPRLQMTKGRMTNDIQASCHISILKLSPSLLFTPRAADGS
jgi:hypothetical protein